MHDERRQRDAVDKTGGGWYREHTAPRVCLSDESGSMATTQTRAEATINDILNAAEIHFGQRNYADVSMSDIAYLADVTKGALYHHFKNKEALYVAMLTRDLEEKRIIFQQAVDAPGTCRDRLELSTKLLFQMPEAKRRLIRLVRRDINIFKGKTRALLVKAYQDALPQSVQAIIQAGFDTGEIAPGDARLLAWEYIALVEGVLTDYAQDTLGGPEQCVQFVLNLFLNGAGTQ
ncbi:MAG: TetR/AcrR family transcriptional regulator [Anaerolineae bacterium]